MCSTLIIFPNSTALYSALICSAGESGIVLPPPTYTNHLVLSWRLAQITVAFTVSQPLELNVSRVTTGEERMLPNRITAVLQRLVPKLNLSLGL